MNSNVDFPGSWTYDHDSKRYFYWSNKDRVYKFQDGTTSTTAPRGLVQQTKAQAAAVPRAKYPVAKHVIYNADGSTTRTAHTGGNQDGEEDEEDEEDEEEEDDDDEEEDDDEEDAGDETQHPAQGLTEGFQNLYVNSRASAGTYGGASSLPSHNTSFSGLGGNTQSYPTQSSYTYANSPSVTSGYAAPSSYNAHGYGPAVPQYGQPTQYQPSSSYYGANVSSTGVSAGYASQPQTPQNMDQSVAPFGYRGYIRGAEIGTKKELHPEYKIQKPGKKFFVAGKVFKILWPEMAGIRNPSITITADNKFTSEGIATKIRWFIVVREGAGFCWCLPINTYGRQGTAKRGIQKWQHAIAYSTRSEPAVPPEETPSLGENPMLPGIRIKPRKPGNKIDPKSRIDFGRIYTVEHNVKVYNFGTVHPDYLQRLRDQWWRVLQSDMGTSRQLGPMAESPGDEEEEDEEDEEDEDEESSSSDEPVAKPQKHKHRRPPQAAMRRRRK